MSTIDLAMKYFLTFISTIDINLCFVWYSIIGACMGKQIVLSCVFKNVIAVK